MQKKLLLIPLLILAVTGCGGSKKQTPDSVVYNDMTRSELFAAIEEACDPETILASHTTLTSTVTEYLGTRSERHMRFGLNSGLYGDYHRTADGKDIYTINYMGETTISAEDGISKAVYLDPASEHLIKDEMFPFDAEYEEALTVTSANTYGDTVELVMESDDKETVQKWALAYGYDAEKASKVFVTERIDKESFVLKTKNVSFRTADDEARKNVLEAEFTVDGKYKYLDKMKSIYEKMYGTDQHTMTISFKDKIRHDIITTAGEGCAVNVFFTKDYEAAFYSDPACTKPLDAGSLSAYKDDTVYIAPAAGNSGGSGEGTESTADGTENRR